MTASQCFDLYKEQYGDVVPIRKAKFNTMLAQILKELGKGAIINPIVEKTVDLSTTESFELPSELERILEVRTEALILNKANSYRALLKENEYVQFAGKLFVGSAALPVTITYTTKIENFDNIEIDEPIVFINVLLKGVVAANMEYLWVYANVGTQAKWQLALSAYFSAIEQHLTTEIMDSVKLVHNYEF